MRQIAQKYRLKEEDEEFLLDIIERVGQLEKRVEGIARARMAGQDSGQMAVAEMMEAAGMSLHHRLERLAEVIDSKDRRASLSALKESFRLAGDYVGDTPSEIQATLSQYKDLQAEAKRIQDELVRMESEAGPEPEAHPPVAALPGPQDEQT